MRAGSGLDAYLFAWAENDQAVSLKQFAAALFIHTEQPFAFKEIRDRGMFRRQRQ